MFAGLGAELIAAECVRPPEAELVHQWLAAGASLFTERPAGRTPFSWRALRSVDGAQEGLQVRGAPYFYKWRKLMDLQACFPLRFVAENIGHGCVSVGQVLAERDCDQLTCCRRCCCKTELWDLRTQIMNEYLCVLPSPRRFCFRLCLFAGWLDCQQDYTKTTRQIHTKLACKMGIGATNILHSERAHLQVGPCVCRTPW